MSWQQVAEPHIGHRLTLKEAHSLRCVDCAMTLVIHREQGGPTTSKQPMPLRHPEACPVHVGQRLGTCGGCRADALVEATRVLPALPDEALEVQERMRLR